MALVAVGATSMPIIAALYAVPAAADDLGKLGFDKPTSLRFIEAVKKEVPGAFASISPLAGRSLPPAEEGSKGVDQETRAFLRAQKCAMIIDKLSAQGVVRSPAQAHIIQ